MSTGDPINPDYYKLMVVGDDGQNHQCQVINVVEAVDAHKDFYLGTALVYLLRAGRKEGNDKNQDIKKAIWFLQRGQENS